ncbi:MAG: TetR/AcrR family transcriptional regulator [Pseudomonadota bacterium]
MDGSRTEPGGGPETQGGRRAAILAATADLVARQGYAGVSMRDIAREVGMTAGSLYHHFPSKEELFVAIHARAVARFDQALDAALSRAQTDPWARLEAAAAAHLGELTALGGQVAIVKPDAPGLSNDTAAQVFAARNGYEARFRVLVEDLPLREGVDRSLARLMLMGALNWTPIWMRPGGRAPEDVARAFVAAMRNGIGA